MPGGPRELHLPDWPFGAVGRRLLLETLLLDKPPRTGWTKGELEQRAKVGAGGLDEVLAGALQLKLIEQNQGRWHMPKKLPPIARPLKALVTATANIPNDPIEPLPRRAYKRRT
jgi:hypothetical protein